MEIVTRDSDFRETRMQKDTVVMPKNYVPNRCENMKEGVLTSQIYNETSYYLSFF